MKISVVVPTYKRPELLLRCLRALNKQHFNLADFEVIVVSDGLDEKTSKALHVYKMTSDLNLRFLSLPQKGGPAAARNLGWKNAVSEFIAFTDDDCIPDVNWLYSLWKAYIQHLNTCIAFSGRTIVPIFSTPTDYERNISQLEQAEFITANCACTKLALTLVGGLDEAFKMAWREDSDLQFKLMEKNIPIVKVSDALITHPVRKPTWGVSIKEEKKGIYNALLFKKYPALYRQRIQASPPWQYYSIAICALLIIVGLIVNIEPLTTFAALAWLVQTLLFAFKRLQSTSKSFRHISEMIFTSAIIPVLSLYYRIYGSLKFRTLLIP